MAYLNTVIKRAGAAAPSSSLCNAVASRSAVVSYTSIRTFASEGKSNKDVVPRTPTGEVQKHNNLASEVGKKMQEVAPGSDTAEPASRGEAEQPKQEREKGGSK